MRDREKNWRKELINLSDNDLDDELIDELMKPTGDWREDVNRETLRRILISSFHGSGNNSHQKANDDVKVHRSTIHSDGSPSGASYTGKEKSQ